LFAILIETTAVAAKIAEMPQVSLVMLGGFLYPSTAWGHRQNT
jgi:hypothetical protein